VRKPSRLFISAVHKCNASPTSPRRSRWLICTLSLEQAMVHGISVCLLKDRVLDSLGQVMRFVIFSMLSSNELKSLMRSAAANRVSC
jgi:hypothetical protein